MITASSCRLVSRATAPMLHRPYRPAVATSSPLGTSIPTPGAPFRHHLRLQEERRQRCAASLSRRA